MTYPVTTRHPGAPWGAVEASTTFPTASGRVNATRCATKLPMLKPSRSKVGSSIASVKAVRRAPSASTVSAGLPVLPPTPGRSTVITRRCCASVSMSAGSQLSRFPRKCCSANQHAAYGLAHVTVGIFNAVCRHDAQGRGSQVAGCPRAGGGTETVPSWLLVTRSVPRRRVEQTAARRKYRCNVSAAHRTIAREVPAMRSRVRAIPTRYCAVMCFVRQLERDRSPGTATVFKR